MVILGLKKTANKIQSAFYWPGNQVDVTFHCKSCDVCQKIVDKGSVPKMPLIDKPAIKPRVAIDRLRPISPPSEEGHRYIHALVEFATRNPLNNTDTETIVQALVNIFSRLGIPEEILSDLDKQFVSGCIKEVTRLLIIKQLSTTPYRQTNKRSSCLSYTTMNNKHIFNYLPYWQLFVRRGRRSNTDIDFRYKKLKILPFMVTNVGKDGTFRAYSCFSTVDSFRFEEIVSGNGAFQEI